MTVCTDRSSYRNKGKEVRDLCVPYPTSAKTMTDRLNVAIKCRWHHSDISSSEWKVHKWLQKDQREQNNHKLDQKHYRREGAEEILKNRAIPRWRLWAVVTNTHWSGPSSTLCPPHSLWLDDCCIFTWAIPVRCQVSVKVESNALVSI